MSPTPLVPMTPPAPVALAPVPVPEMTPVRLAPVAVTPAAFEAAPVALLRPLVPVDTPAGNGSPADIESDPADASPFVTTPDLSELIRDLETVAPSTDPHAMQDEVPPMSMPRRPNLFGSWRRLAVAVLALVALGEGGVIAARAYRKPAPPTSGTLSVQTNPQGVAVFVDGVAKGNTPARLSLTPGSHIIELRGRGVPRVMPVTISAGAETSQYLELPETPSVGSLLVQSEPAGAKVTVDGVERGAAPISVADLAPGEHDVILQGEGVAPVKQRVVIQAGVTATVLAPVATAAAGPVSGWLSVKSPVSIELHEGGRLIGTTDTDRIMLAAGRHDVELVNETLGYHASRTIQVVPGKVAGLSLELPQGVINLNASPWAEVFIDGRPVGETPIGNLAVSIGPHEVIFRNPQFGEKKQAISVTLNAPVRLSVDMK
jgi:hypothetical protein